VLVVKGIAKVTSDEHRRGEDGEGTSSPSRPGQVEGKIEDNAGNSQRNGYPVGKVNKRRWMRDGRIIISGNGVSRSGTSMVLQKLQAFGWNCF
jgi:hypothetical protein